MIEFDEAWNQKHDPQRQTPAGFCKVCGGEIFELETLEAYDGMCPACWWAENGGQGTGNGEPGTGDGGTDSSTPLRSAQNDEGGDGA